MHVILQGSMRFFRARQLLALLGSHGHSGTFDAESGEKRVRILFREGRIDWTDGGNEADALSVITDLISWTDGSFTFLEATALPEGASALALDAMATLAEAEKRLEEALRVQQLFPDDQTIFHVVPKPQGDISLRPIEFQVLFQIGNGRSLAQLRSEMKLPVLDLYPIINTLKSRGLIATDEEPVAADHAVPRKTASRRKPTMAGQPSTLIQKKTLVEQAKPPRVATLTGDDGTMYPLLDDANTIGRTDANTVVIADGSVSSRHARILRAHDTFTLEDLGSRNGTFVDGEKVAEPRLLADGDIVRFGKIILTFNVAAETLPKDSTQPEIKVGRSPDR